MSDPLILFPELKLLYGGVRKYAEGVR